MTELVSHITLLVDLSTAVLISNLPFFVLWNLKQLSRIPGDDLTALIVNCIDSASIRREHEHSNTVCIFPADNLKCSQFGTNPCFSFENELLAIFYICKI